MQGYSQYRAASGSDWTKFTPTSSNALPVAFDLRTIQDNQYQSWYRKLVNLQGEVVAYMILYRFAGGMMTYPVDTPRAYQVGVDSTYPISSTLTAQDVRAYTNFRPNVNLAEQPLYMIQYFRLSTSDPTPDEDNMQLLMNSFGTIPDFETVDAEGRPETTYIDLVYNNPFWKRSTLNGRIQNGPQYFIITDVTGADGVVTRRNGRFISSGSAGTNFVRGTTTADIRIEDIAEPSLNVHLKRNAAILPGWKPTLGTNIVPDGIILGGQSKFVFPDNALLSQITPIETTLTVGDVTYNNVSNSCLAHSERWYQGFRNDAAVIKFKRIGWTQYFETSEQLVEYQDGQLIPRGGRLFVDGNEQNVLYSYFFIGGVRF